MVEEVVVVSEEPLKEPQSENMLVVCEDLALMSACLLPMNIQLLQ